MSGYENHICNTYGNGYKATKIKDEYGESKWFCCPNGNITSAGCIDAS